MEKKTIPAVKPGLPDPNKATFTLLIYFKDENRRVFYSYHTSYNAELKKIIIDDKTALNKLIRQIHFNFKGTFKTAIIYPKETNRQLYKWVNDRLIFQNEFSFTWINGAVKILLH